MKFIYYSLSSILLFMFTPTSAAILVSGYDFVGGSIEDKVGSNDLTESTTGTGGVTFGTDGSYSFATFNNDGNNESLDATATFTADHPSMLSFWVRDSSISNGTRIGSMNGITIEYAGSSNLRTRDGGGSNAFSPGSSFVTTGGAWNLISIYIDQNQPSGTLSLFVNSAGTVTTPADVSGYGSGLDTISFAPTFDDFSGDIGGIRVYGSVANQAEAEALHDSLLLASGPTAIPEPSTFLLVGLAGLSLLVLRRRR